MFSFNWRSNCNSWRTNTVAETGCEERWCNGMQIKFCQQHTVGNYFQYQPISYPQYQPISYSQKVASWHDNCQSWNSIPRGNCEERFNFLYHIQHLMSIFKLHFTNFLWCDGQQIQYCNPPKNIEKYNRQNGRHASSNERSDDCSLYEMFYCNDF